MLLAIARCRTAALGGHLDQCTRCGPRATISYNSCRNRQCPKCQTSARERWIAARQRELLPTRFVHVVFTLPTGSRPGSFSTHNNRPQPPPFRFELETRGHWCISFRKANSIRKFSDEMYRVGPKASGRLGPGPTKSSAVGSYFKAGIPVLSLILSSRGVWVSLFRRGYRPVSGLANSASGLTSGETFVAGD